MNAKEFQKLCKSSSLRGGYLFFGEEDYLKNRCLLAARQSLFGGEDDPFNHIVISGENADWFEELAGQMMSLPMFADKKLVELVSLDYTRLKKEEIEALAELLEGVKEQEEIVLILSAGCDEFDAGRLPKKPSAAYKTLSAVLEPVQFSYETAYNLSSWVIRHFSARGLACDGRTASALIDFCSQDMFILSQEIAKLAAYTEFQGKKEVDISDIEKVCCGHNIEGAFDFTDALLGGRSEQAARLLAGMKARREKPELILTGVVDTLSGMYTVKILADEGLRDNDISAKTGLHAYRVEKFRRAAAGKSAARLEKALDLCMDADLKIKSSQINNYTVLDRLVLRLCRV